MRDSRAHVAFFENGLGEEGIPFNSKDLCKPIPT